MFPTLFYKMKTKSKHIVYFSARLRHKLNKKNEKEAPRTAPDVIQFLDSSPENRAIKEKLPKFLFRKYKAPENMYLINSKTAKVIANVVKNHLSKESPIIEVNPGLGFLSEELLKCQENPIYMYEISNHFSQHLNVLEKQYPGRIHLKVADFFGMWKLAFQDKMDHGNRIQELLGCLITNNNDRIVKIIGSMPGLSFVRHLINNIVFHNTTNQLGRPDLFITMPGHQYEIMKCSALNRKLFQHYSNCCLTVKY